MINHNEELRNAALRLLKDPAVQLLVDPQDESKNHEQQEEDYQEVDYDEDNYFSEEDEFFDVED